MKSFLTPLLGALLLWGVSCNLPVGLQKANLTPVSLGSDDSRLVIRFTEPSSSTSKALYDYGLGNIGFVAVQASSSSNGQMKFATAAVSGGVATLDLTGMVAGSWYFTVSCYDWDGNSTSPTGTAWTDSPDQTKPLLLYSGRATLNIQPGTEANLPVLLYKSGSVGDITATEAIVADNVSVAPASSTYPGSSIPGEELLIAAQAKKGVALASDQVFTWSSSDPSIARVEPVYGYSSSSSSVNSNATPTARVFAQKFGTATITATAIGGATGTYNVTVSPTGYWVYGSGVSSKYLVIAPNGAAFTYRTNIGAPEPSYSPLPSQFRGDLSALVAGTTSWTVINRAEYNFADDTLGSSTTLSGYDVQLLGSQIRANLPTPTPSYSPSPLPLLNRVANPVPVASVSTPAPSPPPGSYVTGQAYYFYSAASPSNATIPGTVITATSPDVIVSNSIYSAEVRFKKTGNFTIKASAVDDPTKTATATVNVASLGSASSSPYWSSSPALYTTDVTMSVSPAYYWVGSQQVYYPITIEYSLNNGPWTQGLTVAPTNSSPVAYTYTGAGSQNLVFRAWYSGTDSLGVEWAKASAAGPSPVISIPPYIPFSTPTGLDGSGMTSATHFIYCSIPAEVPSSRVVLLEGSTDGGLTWNLVTTLSAPTTPGGTVSFNHNHGSVTNEYWSYRFIVKGGLDVNGAIRADSAPLVSVIDAFGPTP